MVAKVSEVAEGELFRVRGALGSLEWPKWQRGRDLLDPDHGTKRPVVSGTPVFFP
jgi:hypothetical protein